MQVRFGRTGQLQLFTPMILYNLKLFLLSTFAILLNNAFSLFLIVAILLAFHFTTSTFTSTQLKLFRLLPCPSLGARPTRQSVQNHSCCVSVPRSLFSQHRSFFVPRVSRMGNALAASCFPSKYSVKIFKSRANFFLLSLPYSSRQFDVS